MNAAKETPPTGGHQARADRELDGHSISPIALSLGDDVRKPSVRTETLELPALQALLTTPTERDEKAGPYFCAPMANGHRCKADALPWQLLALDFDGKIGPVPDPETSKAFFAPWLHFGHTTHSYAPGNGKHRIVVVLDREISADEYRQLFEVLAAVCPAVPDPALNHPDQPVFLPSCPPGAERLAWSNLEKPFPVDTWLAAYHTPPKALPVQGLRPRARAVR